MTAPAESIRTRRRLGARTALFQWLFVVPALVYIGLYFAYPILQNIVTGFQHFTASTFYTGEAPWVGLDNYVQVIGSSSFFPVVRNTLLFTIGSTVGQFLLGLLLANFFRKHFPLGRVVRSLLLLPWLLPVIVATAIWRSLFDQDQGALSQLLQNLGVVSSGVPWLTSPNFALVSVIIVNIWIGVPFMLTILYGGLTEIPEEIYEAGALDGATGWRAFRHLTWPLLRPTVNVAVLLGVIYTLRSLDIILGLTRGGPANATQTMPTQSYQLSFQLFDFGQGAAMSNLLIVISFVFALVYLRANRPSVVN
ncbi:ABC transporter permease [Subtercola sp. Z020]|uniref:carbohydrate ABC transporter permease n=1 Tax=Subtercola sp. Z020 TaxID=2080582 RepID=UPI000CE868F0|nr:sugar ABC transporter permease [Subtercola sp. Z020]PPF89522.1 ABC transporter permease [Subtercola sp. Z020]